MIITGYIITLITTMLVMPLPESPRFLLSLGKADEFKKALDKMARWNGRTIDWSTIDV